MKRWIVRLAARDTLKSAPRLLSSYLALLFGIAALVAVLGVRSDFQNSLQQNTQRLLGSDLEFSSKRPFSKEFEEKLKPFLAHSSQEVRFRTMAVNTANGSSRLVQVQAIDGGFPFYGEISTDPPGKWSEVQHAATDTAIAEESLFSQLGLHLGDTLKIGDKNFSLVGIVRSAPGLMIPAYVIAPRVYVRKNAIDGSPLLDRGALADYSLHSIVKPGITSEEVVQKLMLLSATERIESRTPAQRAEILGAIYTNVAQFLSLAAFAALMIGACAAVAATHVYLLQKVSFIATLRCIGADRRAVSLVCLYEIIFLASLAGFVGTIVGIVGQFLLAYGLKNFTPFVIESHISARAIIAGLLVGLMSVVLYSLPQLLQLEAISPLEALRPKVGQIKNARRYRGISFLLIVIIVAIFAACTADSLKMFAIGFSAVVLGIAIFSSAALCTLIFVKAIPDTWIPAGLRYGIKNLARPGNATVALLSALGLVSLLGNSILIAGHFLQKQADVTQNFNTPNAFLYDIQLDQRDDLHKFLDDSHIPILQETPVVLMRLQSLKKIDVGQLLTKADTNIPAWSLTREYWSSYRSELAPNESLTKGVWIKQVSASDSPVPVSVEDRMAERLGIDVGDEIVFDIQGQSLAAKVTSLRSVQWERMERNALMVFPEGVLENVPQFRFLSLHLASADQLKLLQSVLNTDFPNISLVDLRLIIQSVNDIITRLRWALVIVTAVIAFSCLLGLLGVSVAGKEVRQKELLLLRVLGASRNFLRQTIAAEYAALAVLGILIGSSLSLCVAKSLSHFLFKTAFSIPHLQMALFNCVLFFLIVVVAAGAHRSLRNIPPIKLIQSE